MKTKETLSDFEIKVLKEINRERIEQLHHGIEFTEAVQKLLKIGLISPGRRYWVNSSGKDFLEAHKNKFKDKRT